MSELLQWRLPLTAPPPPAVCQRWRDRASRWRTVGEAGIDPRAYEVGPLEEATARAFVTRHHYAASYPAARLRYGLWEHTGALVGVAVLSVPVRREVLTGPFPQLEAYQESLELGRFVLLDRVPANGESWFLGQLFHEAARDGVRGLVSFSDPVARTTADGATIFPGHLGVIYQATNAHYLGRSRPRTLTLRADGTVLNERTIAKAKSGERGCDYARAQLEDAGETRQLRHGGNHRYCFILGNKRERRALTRDLERQPYPKGAPHE